MCWRRRLTSGPRGLRQRSPLTLPKYLPQLAPMRSLRHNFTLPPPSNPRRRPDSFFYFSLCFLSFFSYKKPGINSFCFRVKKKNMFFKKCARFGSFAFQKYEFDCTATLKLTISLYVFFSPSSSSFLSIVLKVISLTLSNLYTSIKKNTQDHHAKPQKIPIKTGDRRRHIFRHSKVLNQNQQNSEKVFLPLLSKIYFFFFFT